MLPLAPTTTVVVSFLKSCSPLPKTEIRSAVPFTFADSSTSALLQLTLTVTSTLDALPSPRAGGISTSFLNDPVSAASAGGQAPGLSTVGVASTGAGGGSGCGVHSFSLNLSGPTQLSIVEMSAPISAAACVRMSAIATSCQG